MWILVRCQVGHEQAIRFSDDPKADDLLPNSRRTIVITCDWGPKEITDYHKILGMVPAYCGVCSALLTYELKEE